MRPPRPSKGFQGWGDRLRGAAWGRRGAAQQEQRLGSKPGSATKQACDWRSCGFSRPRIPLIENPHLGFCSLLRALHGTQNSLNSQGQRGCSLEESCLGHSVISKMPHGTRWHMLRPNGWIRHPRPGLLREQALWLKKPRKASGKSWALFSGTENASQERKPWKPAAEWLLDEAHAASGECSSSWERHRTGKTCQPSPPQRKGSPKKPEKPEHFRRPAPGPLLASAPGERRNMPTLSLSSEWLSKVQGRPWSMGKGKPEETKEDPGPLVTTLTQAASSWSHWLYLVGRGQWDLPPQPHPEPCCQAQSSRSAAQHRCGHT